jgi:CHAT domain-containing protein
MLEASLLQDLQALYRELLARPLAGLDARVRHLIIVPCDVLHTLPLEALHDGDTHLLSRYTVCYLPAASLLAALPSKGADAAGRSLLLAHSQEGRLPQAVVGTEAIAQLLAAHPAAEPLLLLEKQATTQALRQHAADARLLHVDAHGIFRDDAPLFSSLHLADGPLTVHDVYGLDLSRAALVTLGGCQTGLGRSRGGEMLGLTHAFFMAGASALVVSRWQVADEITAELVQAFYAGLVQGQPIVEALRTAKLETLSRYPHAGYWAAFSAWGRGADPIFHQS